MHAVFRYVTSAIVLKQQASVCVGWWIFVHEISFSLAKISFRLHPHGLWINMWLKWKLTFQQYLLWFICAQNYL